MLNIDTNDLKCLSCDSSLRSFESVHGGERIDTTGTQSIGNLEDDQTLFLGIVCFHCKAIFCNECKHGPTCPKCQRDAEPAYLKNLRELSRQINELGGSGRVDNKDKSYISLEVNKRILLRALASCNLKQVKDILKKGCDVNVVYPDIFRSDTALVFAAQVLARDPEFVETLLQYGADPNLSTKEAMTALFAAAGHGNIEIAKMLIEKGAEINAGNLSRGFTALYIAVENSHHDMVTFLIERGANINVQAEYGWTPLHRAIANGDYSMVELLIEKGANVNAVGTGDDITPLSQSIEKNMLTS